MNLSQLKTSEEGVITKVRGRGAFRKRITEMGFIKGKKVKVIKNAPLKDPIEYSLMGYELSLRRSEAQLIEVITEKEATGLFNKRFNGVEAQAGLVQSAKIKGKNINVALVGNPNSGKTTLFNYASHSREHVGNYGGVTVGSKAAKFRQEGYTFNVVDLPGTYSLSAYSPEELYVRKFIFGETPDVIINIVDASNLERNLYLTTQLIDMDVKVIIALNMYDELQKRGDQFDYESLGKMMGIPIVPTISSKGHGIKELFKKVIDVYEDKEPLVRHIHINYGKEVEKSLKIIQDEIWKNKSLTDMVSSRFYALKLIEKDKSAHFSLSRWPNYNEIKGIAEIEIERLEKMFHEDSETLITDAKYGFISGALKETLISGQHKRNTTDIIDAFITHKLFGFPIFFLLIFIMFFATFELGQYPMNWLDQSIVLFSGWLQSIIPAGALKDLLIDGIVGGVGSVIVFLPNILILFFFISLMEDTGYMARAAFIMDKIMHKIGLHGQSFIPLIMGFGCNVPAIMATRTIKNRNNRMVTMLINPFMSCSARLPVYILVIGAFFPKHPGLVLFIIYLIGIFIAATVAKILKKTFFRTEEIPFVMELPPYRVPTLKSTLKHMWYKGEQYLKKMGGVILIASILIWALGYYPKNVAYSTDYDTTISTNESQYNQVLESVKFENPDRYYQVLKEKNGVIRSLLLAKEAEKQEKSFIGQIGQFIEPVLKPLGFDWKMGVSLLTGIAAKEVVVSTMGVLYQVGADIDEKSETLIGKIRDQTYTNGIRSGEKVYTPVIAFGFLMFILIYFPCVAVIVVIKKESGSWKWALFTIFYTTSLAWFVAFVVYQIGSLF